LQRANEKVLKVYICTSYRESLNNYQQKIQIFTSINNYSVYTKNDFSGQYSGSMHTNIVNSTKLKGKELQTKSIIDWLTVCLH